jgi:hypothetical protein
LVLQYQRVSSEEGFAVENDLEDDYPGELLFGEGQIERLDNTRQDGYRHNESQNWT